MVSAVMTLTVLSPAWCWSRSGMYCSRRWMCGAELQNAVRCEQPDLRDVVFESAGDEGGHVLEGFRHLLTEEGEA